MSVRSKLDAKWYPGFHDKYDIALLRDEILARLRPDMVALDLGAGRGASPFLKFKGKAIIYGADIDPIVQTNPELDRAFLIEDNKIAGLDASTIDLIFCSSVLEHVAEPDTFFQEIYRVLKPGGLFLAKTPNRYHYMPIVASMTPLWFHKLYNRWRGREEEDTFPTLYRANSHAKIRALAFRSGLTVERLWSLEGRPEYLRLTPPTYLLGFLYERLVNGLKLDGIKCVLFMVLAKPSTPLK